MIPCLIIAEIATIEILSSYIEGLAPLLTLQGSSISSEEGLLLATLYSPGIVYADVELVQQRSAEFNALKDQCCLVILSEEVSDQDTFQNLAFDYMVKPFLFSKFDNSLKKYGEFLYQLIMNKRTVPLSADPDYIKICDKHLDDILIKHTDLLYIEGMQNYVKYFDVNETSYLEKITMKLVEEKLLRKSFSRVHKSFIINDDRIAWIKGNLICLDDAQHTKIRIGATYRKAFFAKAHIKQIRNRKQKHAVVRNLNNPALGLVLCMLFENLLDLLNCI